MSLGLAIFLGCVILGTVYLYVRTRDQWNWRTIAKRTLISLAALLGLVSVAVLGFIGYDSGYFVIPSRIWVPELRPQATEITTP